MLEALALLAFWRKDRRQRDDPVTVERRRMTPKRAQERLAESVNRLQCAVERKQSDLTR